MTDAHPEIEAVLADHLEAELGDAAIARAFAAALVEDALTWRAPTVPPREVRTIIGFTFGNRMLPNGNREPGPANAALADVAVRLHEATGARVWAQWEVAEAIGGRAPEGMVEAIYPVQDGQAEPRYLSTGGSSRRLSPAAARRSAPLPSSLCATMPGAACGSADAMVWPPAFRKVGRCRPTTTLARASPGRGGASPISCTTCTAGPWIAATTCWPRPWARDAPGSSRAQLVATPAARPRRCAGSCDREGVLAERGPRPARCSASTRQVSRRCDMLSDFS
jgi:hypothetical protein